MKMIIMMVMMTITVMLYGRFDKNYAKGVAALLAVCVTRYTYSLANTSFRVFFLYFNNTVS